MAFCFILKLKIFLIYLLSLVFSCCTTPCHSLSLIEIFITRCHWLVVTGCLSLPFVVTWFITHYHSLSLVVTCCHSLCHRLSFVVTRYHSLYHSMSFVRHELSLDVPLICLFINDRFFIAFWPPVPKVILLLQWGWCQIVQQDMNSHSVSHFILLVLKL